jgi:hypothetical protein
MEPKGREYLSLFLQPLTDQPIHNFKFQISNPPPIQSHIIPHFVSNFNFNSSLFGSLSHPLRAKSHGRTLFLYKGFKSLLQ